MSVIGIVAALILYTAGIIAAADRLGWQSDIIGGLLTLPIEIVFIAALLDQFRARRERLEWQPTREQLIDNSRALLGDVQDAMGRLELAFNTSKLSELKDPQARAQYAAVWSPSVALQAREWTTRHDAWLQSMQFSAACLSPALARHMVALNETLKAFKRLYEHLQAIAENREKQRALGEIHTQAAAFLWDYVKGVDDVFAVEGSTTDSPEVSAAVNAWASATALLGRMYQEVGYVRSVMESEHKVVYTRGDKVHSFLQFGDGFRSTLVGIETCLRGLRG
jgi:hypothetical protein